MNKSFFPISFFAGTELEGFPEDSVFVSVRRLSKKQISDLAMAITKDLGIKPRFSLPATMDVLREDQLKSWPAHHELMLGFTAGNDGKPVFRTRAPEQGGNTIVTYEFFMDCVRKQKAHMSTEVTQAIAKSTKISNTGNKGPSL